MALVVIGATKREDRRGKTAAPASSVPVGRSARIGLRRGRRHRVFGAVGCPAAFDRFATPTTTIAGNWRSTGHETAVILGALVSGRGSGTRDQGAGTRD